MMLPVGRRNSMIVVVCLIAAAMSVCVVSEGGASVMIDSNGMTLTLEVRTVTTPTEHQPLQPTIPNFPNLPVADIPSQTPLPGIDGRRLRLPALFPGRAKGYWPYIAG